MWRQTTASAPEVLDLPIEQTSGVSQSDRVGRRLGELAGKLARMAYQFQFLRVDRVARELMAISNELSTFDATVRRSRRDGSNG